MIRSAKEHATSLMNLVLTKVFPRAFNVYWYNRVTNFGDLITPYLFDKYGYRALWTMPRYSSFVSTGSVLQHFQKPYTGIVFGSGLIAEDSPVDMLKSANIVGVRGKLTLTKLGLVNPSGIVLGDPGLLCSKFVDVPSTKQWKIGLVPHYVDEDADIVKSLAQLHSGDLKIIDVKRQPEEVWKDLATCEVVLSSSLHGIICADSLGIPTAWIRISEQLLGGGFKFSDYYSAFDELADPVVLKGDESIDVLMNHAAKRNAQRLEEIVKDLDNMFLSLGGQVGSFKK